MTSHARPNSELVAEMLRQHGRELRAFVRARMPAEEVDDLLQRVALRAVEQASTLQDPAKVVPWLYRLHRNAITDWARRRAFRREASEQHRLMEETQGATAELAEDPCGCSVVLAERLGGSHARVLSLVDVEGLSLSDAAEMMGITTNAATVRLHRARKALRKRMRDHCGVTSAGECADCRCTYDGCCAA